MLHHALRFAAAQRASDLPPLDQDISEVRITIYMGFVSFVILVWDHIVTLADEVEYIWQGNKGLLVYLFFLNRYLTPLGFIINLFASFDSLFVSVMDARSECGHFVRYEGSMTVIGINTTALMMLIRVSALYHRNRLVVAFVAAFFCVELGVNAWLLSHGQAVIHNRSIHACTMIFDDSVKGIASASAWLPLTYDTIVLVLTIFRTLDSVRNKTTGKIARVLLRDGVLYYSVIFSVNFVLTLMIVAAPPGVQNITAQLEYLLTVAMMSRITIRLRKQVVGAAEEHGLIVSNSLYSSVTETILRTRLRFQHGSSGQTTLSTTEDVGVVVEETSVVHDDGGNVVEGPVARARKDDIIREWYELRPPAHLLTRPVVDCDDEGVRGVHFVT